MDTTVQSFKQSHLKTAKIGLMILLLGPFMVNTSWAASPSSPENTTSDQQPAVAVSEAATSTTTSANPSSAEMPQDFLTDHSPLSKPTPEPEKAVTEATVIAVSGPGKECSSTGNQENGSQSCVEKNLNGSFSEKISNWENFGNETKKQTVLRYYSSNGNPAGEDTIRIKTLYLNQDDGVKRLGREFYDIVSQPAKGLITRDFIIKTFDSLGQIAKITWAHYREIGFKKAGLEHHAVLYYKDGQLSSGYADKYKDGKIIDTFFNYNPEKNPNLRMEMTGITKWAGWIDQLTHSTNSRIVI